MKTTKSTILPVMKVLFWIAFFGLCIQTGAIAVSFFVSLFINPIATNDLYLGLNLSDLRAYSELLYILIVLLLIWITALKAYIAYLVVRFFMKFELSKPFGLELTSIFLKISHIALTTAVIAILASGLSKWIMKSESFVAIPIDWSGKEILFFAGVIYIFALVFQKGTELQNDNELTV